MIDATVAAEAAATEPRSGPVAGVLPSQALSEAIDAQWIGSGDYRIRPEAIQPASIDLRHGAVLERDRPYLVPLIEELALPDDVRAKANPKSSTGRLDVFTRVLTDRHHRFDEIRPGYRGRLYLEVVPRSFAIQVQSGLSLNQLRLARGDVRLSDAEIRALQDEFPLLYLDSHALRESELALAEGLFLSVDLSGPGDRIVGYRAKKNSLPIDLARVRAYRWNVYLAGEIHSDWRERIEAGVREAGLAVSFAAPVTDHAASDDAGVGTLGEEGEPFWRDQMGAGVNAIRTQTLIRAADIVVVRFGDKYRQWNAAFDAGFAAALGKPYVTLHDAELDHALKEVDRAAQGTARTAEQVVDVLRYAIAGKLP